MLPMMVVLFLVKKIPVSVIADWAVIYSLILIVVSFIFTPQEIEFSLKFDASKKDSTYVPIYSLINSSIIGLIFASIVYIIGYDILTSFLATLFLIMRYVWNSVVLKLKFYKEYEIYFFLSILKFFMFSCLLLISLKFSYVSINWLLTSVVLSNTPFLIYFLGMDLAVTEFRIMKFIHISIYGAVIIFLSSYEKVVLELIDRELVLATVTYVVGFCSAPLIMTETLKKFFVADLFADLNRYGFYSRRTQKRVLKSVILLNLIYIFSVALLLLVFYGLGLIDSRLVNIRSDWATIFMFALGYMIFNFYHFLNPVLFFYEEFGFLSRVAILLAVVGSMFVFWFADTLFLLSVSRLFITILLVVTIGIKVKYFRNARAD